MSEKVYIKNRSGLRLAGIWQFPKQRTNKAVVLAHGITVDKNEHGTFIKLANALQDKGFAVFRFDFRGHGESEGESINVTLTGEIEDLDAAVGEVEKRGYEKIGLLGASFGGGISALFSKNHEYRLSCLCLWNPTLNYDHCYLNPTKPSIIKLKAHLKKDIEEKGWANLYGKNFKIGKKLYNEMAKFFPYKALEQITIPTLIVHGTKDEYVPYEDSKLYVNNLKGIHLFFSVEGSDHGFHEEPYSTQVKYRTIAFFQKFL